MEKQKNRLGEETKKNRLGDKLNKMASFSE
jgi:hypothetical protein